MAFTVVLLTSLDHVTYALPDCKRIVRVWYDSELLRPDDDTFLRVSTAAEVVAALDASPTTTTTTVTSSSDKLLSLLLDLVVQSNANEMVVLLPERPIFVSALELDQARLIRYLSLADARTLLSLQQGSRITRLLDSLFEAFESNHDDEVTLSLRWPQYGSTADTRVSRTSPDFGPVVRHVALRTASLVSLTTKIDLGAAIVALTRHNAKLLNASISSSAIATLVVDISALSRDQASQMEHEMQVTHSEPVHWITLLGSRVSHVYGQLSGAVKLFDEHRLVLLHGPDASDTRDAELGIVLASPHRHRLVSDFHDALFGERWNTEAFGDTMRDLEQQRCLDGDAVVPRVFADAWWVSQREQLLRLFEGYDGSKSFYAYHKPMLVEAARQVRSIKALDRVYYAVKANPNREVLRTLREEGIAFECVSPGEIDLVRSEFPDIVGQDILFTPNFAPREDYQYGLSLGATVTIDCLHPLEFWPELFQDREVFIRMDPGVGRGHHEKVQTAGKLSKFGVAAADFPRLLQLVEQHRVKVVGLHCHVGSGILEASTWKQTAQFLFELRPHFPHLRALDLGGGLGVVERPTQQPLEIARVADMLQAFKDEHPDLSLWLEPGRFLVARASVLVSQVTQIKHKQGVVYIGIGTGFNSLIRPTLYGAYHHIVNLTRLPNREGPFVHAEIVGPICETGDVFGHARRVHESAEGDVLLIATTGAYGRSMSSHYNLRDPAEEVWV